ncbi:MAG TPA: DUF1289 domain-containing protein [Rhodobacteraceae bacterium]|jgi:predicted Fe-S protein YdhL (DUF1289 family)|nr:DUF1289 domain-containing protein [Paracoccaceae bacterium]HBG97457.1 DUF1289 domain-containing protein [Paracoccaceae bacterium]
MTDDIWRRDEPESPCIKICVIERESRLCTGCLRSIDEIAAWGAMSPEARRAIMAELPGRAPQLQKRRGGRAGRLARGGG